MHKQQVLNHIYNYFNDRLNNHGGACNLGWGSASDPGSRCALASLVKGTCQRGFEFYHQIGVVLGLSPLSNKFCEAGGFYFSIMEFNDVHSTHDEGEILTAELINNFCNDLAQSHGLISPVSLHTKTEEVVYEEV